jgi:quaternary ammonium compound-resistance protein SugE
MKAWIYIITAVILQTLWGMVLKVLDFNKAGSLIQEGDVFNLQFIIQILPILAYFLLGLLIAIVISKAYKMMPMSIVYAAWMGLTLALQVVVDVFFYGERMKALQYVCILLILLGILGMKLSNPKSIQQVEVEIDDSVD